MKLRKKESNTVGAMITDADCTRRNCPLNFLKRLTHNFSKGDLTGESQSYLHPNNCTSYSLFRIGHPLMLITLTASLKIVLASYVSFTPVEP